MNYEKLLQATREYLTIHLSEFKRGDLHIRPQISREELLDYFKNQFGNFPKGKFMRFVNRMQKKGVVMDASKETLYFDPIFPY